MDDILKELIEKLPDSPTALDASNIKKIHEYIPVPSDYDIKWADILSLGGYPAGVVLTDKALILKASRDEVKENKKQIQKGNTGRNREDRVKPPTVIYQIIPWEYYSPAEYELVETTSSDGSKRYFLKAGDTVLARFGSAALFQMLRNYKKEILEQRQRSEATFSAINSVNVEDVMFNAAYGADQTKTGHGIYAEEAGAILDKISGEQSTVVGRDNAKNGPDKIVDSSPIQCKYYKTPSATVNACFKKDPVTGTKSFRYYDLSGNAMKIEVPADQYSQAIEYMKTRIANGNVPGVTDPDAAYTIIRKGKLTYNQALNLAKAGTVESIALDAVTGAVSCLSALGVSSVVAFAQVYWATKDYKKAAKSAIFTGLQVYGLSFAGGVIASQISRTGIVSYLKPVTNEISKAISPKAAREIVNAFRALAGKKAVYGTAAQKSFAKFLGSTAITQVIMIGVFSVPDTCKALSGKMSAAQYFKNMSSLAASFAGSVGGTAIAGAVIGKGGADALNTKAVSAIGMAAGFIGGALFGTTVKAIGNMLHEDDAVITARLFNGILINQFIDYLLSGEEQDKVIRKLDSEEKELKKLQQSLRTSSSQEHDIREFTTPIIEEVVKNRGHISLEDERQMEKDVPALITNGELIYGV